MENKTHSFTCIGQREWSSVDNIQIASQLGNECSLTKDSDEKGERQNVAASRGLFAAKHKSECWRKTNLFTDFLYRTYHKCKFIKILIIPNQSDIQTMGWLGIRLPEHITRKLEHRQILRSPSRGEFFRTQRCQIIHA